MIKDTIFKSHINLFSPYSNEFIFDYIYALGYTDSDLPSWRIKCVVLKVIGILLDHKIISIYKNFSSIEIVKQDTKSIIDKIDEIWHDDSTYEDFLEMIMLKSQEWYVIELEKIGMTHTTNWKEFVENNIGDLQKWVDENKPQ